MSPTHKPKPPDKGAPSEHKPSRKVALAEVMRSLQDLVSNELAVDEVTPKKRRRADQKQPAARADDAPAVANSAEEIESITLESQPESAIETPAVPEPLAPAKPSVPMGGPSTVVNEASFTTGLQQELPYLDGLTLAPPESPPEPAAPALLSNIPEPVPETTLTLSEENWDDIPVLEEAVELTDDIEADAALSGAPPATALPSASAARRLAIQVAARLNVELRKSGQTGLNSAIITQLAKMLEEALAKDAANMENATGGSAQDTGEIFRSPSEKH